jgi:hypothetical protein
VPGVLEVLGVTLCNGIPLVITLSLLAAVLFERLGVTLLVFARLGVSLLVAIVFERLGIALLVFEHLGVTLIACELLHVGVTS